jgi:hypothetical protein
MKKLILCFTLASLASLALAQAGDGKSSATKKAVSADKAKVTSSAKSGCSETTDCSTTKTSAQTACSEKSACCEKEKVVTKAVKPDQKGATFLVKR